MRFCRLFWHQRAMGSGTSNVASFLFYVLQASLIAAQDFYIESFDPKTSSLAGGTTCAIHNHGTCVCNPCMHIQAYLQPQVGRTVRCTKGWYHHHVMQPVCA
jgi:hypothetical protein